MDVGKTCMLFSYCYGSYPAGYIPEVFDPYSMHMTVDNKAIKLHLWDTKEWDYDQNKWGERFRPQLYPGTDVFLVCYSTSSHRSLDQVKKKWYPEISRFCRGVPFLLIGTKSDIPCDELILERVAENPPELRRRDKPLGPEEGQLVADSLGATKHMICSALTMEGIKEVFDEAVRTVLYPPQRQIHKSKIKSMLCALFSSRAQKDPPQE